MQGNSQKEIKCAICGSKDVVAIINGKYYCFKCASRIVKKNVLSQLHDLEKRGVVSLK